MPIQNAGSKSFENDLAEIFGGLQKKRIDLIDQFAAVQLGIRMLVGLESGRIARKTDTSDKRIGILSERSDAMLARAAALSVERQIAEVRVPATEPTGALVQGRITDETMRAAGTVGVQLIDVNGRPVPGVDPVMADESGYYAFALKPETVTALGDTGVTIVLDDGRTQLVPMMARSLKLAPGTAALLEVALNAAEIEKLQLRGPVASPATQPPVAPAGPPPEPMPEGPTSRPRKPPERSTPDNPDKKK